MVVAPWVAHLRALGAPVETLLARSGISPDLLRQSDSVVPLKNALKWVELACRSVGTEHLGVLVARTTAIETLGPYGSRLARATTLGQYLHEGISLYRTVVVGMTPWLSVQGNRVRVNLDWAWEPRLASYQADLNFFTITIANIRRFAGPQWSPTEVCLGFKAGEPIPADLFGEAHVLYRPGQTYLEFPRAMLALDRTHAYSASVVEPCARPTPLPSDLAGLVELQIECLLPMRALPIDLVAESLGMSRRSLQRRLSACDVSYSDLLHQVQLRRAADWLKHTSKPVSEIAFDLGYSDASNFTRAFRNQTGMSPQRFRQGGERR
jgi:AraC-like DNA-binding protein